MDFPRKMIRCKKIENTIGLSQKLMEHLDLNCIDKVYVTKYYKVKSLEQWWFSEKEHSKKKSVIDENNDSDIYIERYSLIHIICKQVRHQSVEYYLVLSLFTKYNNKLYISEEEKVNSINSSKNKQYSHIS